VCVIKNTHRQLAIIVVVLLLAFGIVIAIVNYIVTRARAKRREERDARVYQPTAVRKRVRVCALLL
jgi:heme/copper-type cytochrome/quinol oxidase subunit 2